MAEMTISCEHGASRQTFGTLVREHFLIHRDEDYHYNGWTVSHINTGLSVVKGVPDRATAIKMARRLANAAKTGGFDLSISDQEVMKNADGWPEFKSEGRAIREKFQSVPDSDS